MRSCDRMRAAAATGGIVLGICLAAVLGAAPHAGATDLPRAHHERRGDVPIALQRHPGEPSSDLPVPAFARDESDTVWFGGDDGQGIAYEGGIWDWDTVVSDPLQGWTSIDETEDPAVYFRWVTPDSFIAHGDPCVPDFFGGGGMLWCGMHEDEANIEDFPGGMGYRNNMCQWARSPLMPIDPAADSIQVRFAYFNDTEPTFDYTFVDLLCYDEQADLIDEYRLVAFDDLIGDPNDPVFYFRVVAPGVLDPVTAALRLQFRMISDAGWSDEDGYWECECGAFAADSVMLAVGACVGSYGFDDGPQGWELDKCPGVGVYMDVYPEGLWSEWVDHAGVLCECTLSGNALGFVDVENCPYWPPGHPIMHEERAFSGVVARGSYDPQLYNAATCEWSHYLYLTRTRGTFFRFGYSYYPYTTEVNPEPHWSPRGGEDRWWYGGSDPFCERTSMSFSHLESEGTPLPAEWDSLQIVYDVLCDCDRFGIPLFCWDEGETDGSPLLDDVRLGLTHVPDGPAIALTYGHEFQDGFGQRFPDRIEPCDVGNANVALDLSGERADWNDWLADSAVVVGPQVSPGDPDGKWACDLCLRIARKGPCQDRAAGYAEWKARFAGDIESEWVCARMDSLELGQEVWAHKYLTCFHESSLGFDPRFPDLSEEQEILPDGILTPGTRIEYEYRGYWYNGGAPPAEHLTLGPFEFEILPGIRGTGGGPQGYDWVYPSVLYIDAYNRGAEYYITAALDDLGLEYDKYDYLLADTEDDAPLRRSFGGGHFNPGGYGNNGATLAQLLGYRFILLSTGANEWALSHNELNPAPDFTLLADWLAVTECGLGDLRRALILDGDEIGRILADPQDGLHIDFAQQTLGVSFVDRSYRAYNSDEAYCVYLEAAPGGAFAPPAPGLSLYGNGCPLVFNYNVLGAVGGLPGVVGNLRFESHLGGGTQPYVDYAQVVREHTVPGEANWRTIVNGFTLHHLSQRGAGGEPCAGDSAAIVAGILDLLAPALEWLGDPEDLFEAWRYPCSDAGIGDQDGESQLAGPVTYLYPSRPNPFTQRATIRFTLASAQHVTIEIFDVTGRVVRTLLDGLREAGEQTIVWDGADDGGHPAPAGVFWMQLRTAAGYASSKRLIRLQ